MARNFTYGSVWLIGATSGIGARVAYGLAARGARLLLSARGGARLAGVARQCSRNGGSVAVLPFDLTDREGCRTSVGRAIRQSRGLDAVIIASGLSQRAYAVDTVPEVRRRLFAVNVEAPIAIAELVVPHLRARAGSQLVVVGSLAGYVSTPLRSSYCAAKHALRAYFESLSFEVKGAPRIRIITPGFVRTDISRHALTGTGAPYARMDNNQRTGMDPERCARKIIRALSGGAAELFVGLRFRGALILAVRACCPPLYRALMRRVPPT